MVFKQYELEWVNKSILQKNIFENSNILDLTVSLRWRRLISIFKEGLKVCTKNSLQISHVTCGNKRDITWQRGTSLFSKDNVVRSHNSTDSLLWRMSLWRHKSNASVKTYSHQRLEPEVALLMKLIIKRPRHIPKKLWAPLFQPLTITNQQQTNDKINSSWSW